MNDVDDAQMTYIGLLLQSGCKTLFKTFIYGKSYLWMKDASGHIFLERIPNEQVGTDS